MRALLYSYPAIVSYSCQGWRFVSSNYEVIAFYCRKTTMRLFSNKTSQSASFRRIQTTFKTMRFWPQKSIVLKSSQQMQASSYIVF